MLETALQLLQLSFQLLQLYYSFCSFRAQLLQLFANIKMFWAALVNAPTHIHAPHNLLKDFRIGLYSQSGRVSFFQQGWPGFEPHNMHTI